MELFQGYEEVYLEIFYGAYKNLYKKIFSGFFFIYTSIKIFLGASLIVNTSMKIII